MAPPPVGPSPGPTGESLSFQHVFLPMAEGPEAAIALPLAETAGGGFTVYEDGSFNLALDLDFAGDDEFSYETADYRRVIVRISTVSFEHGYNALRQSGGVGDIFASLGLGITPEEKEKNLQLLFGPESGYLQIHEDGSFTYIPQEGFTGSDQFTFEVVDETGAVAGQSVVEVIVVPPEPPPPKKE